MPPENREAFLLSYMINHLNESVFKLIPFNQYHISHFTLPQMIPFCII